MDWLVWVLSLLAKGGNLQGPSAGETSTPVVGTSPLGGGGTGEGGSGVDPWG